VGIEPATHLPPSAVPWVPVGRPASRLAPRRTSVRSNPGPVSGRDPSDPGPVPVPQRTLSGRVPGTPSGPVPPVSPVPRGVRPTRGARTAAVPGISALSAKSVAGSGSRPTAEEVGVAHRDHHRRGLRRCGTSHQCHSLLRIRTHT